MNSFKNLLSSAVNKISNPDTVEKYEFSYMYERNFDDIMSNYTKKFEPENLERNNITFCEVIYNEKLGDVICTKRIISINLVKLPVTIPETLMQYIGDTNFVIEHTLEINTKEKTAKIISKNISHSQANFNEISLFSFENNKTIYNLSSSLSINIMIGVNETVRKLWLLQYKLYHENNNFGKKLDY